MIMRHHIILLLTALFLGLSVSAFAIGLQGERYATEAMEYYQRGMYREAINQYLQADRSADGSVPLYHYWLGKLYVAVHDSTNARRWLNDYMASGEETHRTDVQNLLGILDRQTKIFERFEYSDMPRYIYSRNSDYGAVMSPDGNYAYFTSLRPASREKENIWRTERFASGWGRPELISAWNTDKNEAIGSFSSDGNTAYLFGNYERSKIDGDIYISTKQNGRWSAPQNLTVVNSPQVDTHPMIFQDKWLLFASSREGGQGNMDIWVSEYQNGLWSVPQNLGPMINTTGNEQTPYLEFDGRTLIYASDALPGLGGYDLYKSVKIGDSWQDWSIPENLGIPANSIRDDRFFSRVPNSNQGFISTDRKAAGFEKFIAISLEYHDPQSYLTRDPDTGDVISVDFGDEEPVQRSEEVTVTGRVVNEAGDPVQTQIVFEAVIDGQNQRFTVNTDENGAYTLDLPLGPTYNVVVSEEDYMIYTGSYNPETDGNTLNIVLQPLERERVFILENVQFNFDSAELTEASLEILNNSVITLLNNPDIRVEISGHTCNIGTARYNLSLSERRAASVVNYLVSKGVERSRLRSVGYGLTRPLESNRTLAGKIRNRRVEFRVMSPNE